LEECGFDVLSASNGREALDQTKMHPECRLLVSDIRMPVMDGYRLASEVLTLDPHPPIMFLTGYADPLPAHLQNKVTFLKKPISMEELCERARPICDTPSRGRTNKVARRRRAAVGNTESTGESVQLGERSLP
jgi:CheY-like chemotaxis protein